MWLEAICKVLCEVLQPLQPPSGFRSNKLGPGRALPFVWSAGDGHGPDLGQSISRLLKSQLGQVSVLCQEGSLVDALEQGLEAPHARWELLDRHVRSL